MRNIMRNIVLYITLLSIVFLSSCKKNKLDEPGNLVPATVTENSNLPSFTFSDGRKVHLFTKGVATNPVLIILHGGPGSGLRPYYDYLKVLQDDYYLVFWDQRGTGLSERVPNEELTGERYLKDLEEIVNHFSPTKNIYLLGHSWGGAFATYYTQNNPTKVDKLVLIEPGTLNKNSAENTSATDIGFFSTDAQVFLNASDFLTPENDIKADYFLATTYIKPPAEGWHDNRFGYRAGWNINNWRGLWNQTYTFDFTTGLENFTKETLFIVGKEDGRLGKTYQEAYHTSFFTLYEGATYHVPELNHFQLITKSESILPKIREYLNK